MWPAPSSRLSTPATRTGSEGASELRESEERIRGSLTLLDADTERTADEMSAQRESDLASALGRAEGMVERARGLTGVLRERQRSLAQALDAAADADVVSTLEAEGARLGEELAATEAEAEAMAPEQVMVEEVGVRGRRLAGSPSGGLGGRSRAAPGRRGRHGGLGAVGVPGARPGAGPALAGPALRRLAATERRVAVIEGEDHELGERLAEQEQARHRLQATVAETEAAHGRATQRLEGAEEALRQAEQEHHRSVARADALERSLDEARGAAGAELLSGVDGVVGILFDLVELDEGWEDAFEAAAGASVAAVVVSGNAPARSALARLREGGATGAVLALTDPVSGSGTGLGTACGGAAGDRVRSAPTCAPDPGTGHLPGLDAALDTLLAGCPLRARRMVRGHRPGSGPPRPGGGHQGRRPFLVHRVAGAGRRWRGHRSLGRRGPGPGRGGRGGGGPGCRGAHRRPCCSGVDPGRRGSKPCGPTTATRSTTPRPGPPASGWPRTGWPWPPSSRRPGGPAPRSRTASPGIPPGPSSSARNCPVWKRPGPRRRPRLAAAREERRRIDERIAEAAALRAEWEARSAGLIERRRVLTERLVEVERRLTGHADERREAAERRTRLEADATAVERLLVVVGSAQSQLDSALAELRERHRRQLEAVRAGGARLEELRRQRSASEHELAAVRVRLQKVELDLVEATIRRESVIELLRHDLACGPDEALAAPAPELPDDTDPVDPDRASSRRSWPPWARSIPWPSKSSPSWASAISSSRARSRTSGPPAASSTT